MITALEKKELKEALVKAFDEFITVFSSFTEREINLIPFSKSWTPAQVAVHIILATDGIPDGKTSSSDRSFNGYLPRIRPWWEDLNKKFQAPEQLYPSHKRHEKSTLLSELSRCREKDLAIVVEQDLTMLCLDTELPTIGFLTRYEWLWFIEMHLKRHAFQLKNMKGLTIK